MTSGERRIANSEWRMANGELRNSIYFYKSEIGHLSPHNPQSDVSDLSLSNSLICQHAMHYALCPLPKFPTSAIGHLCPMLKIPTSEFRIPHSLAKTVFTSNF
jgi:hypothetical protein